jgi:alpha-galactosidase
MRRTRNLWAVTLFALFCAKSSAQEMPIKYGDLAIEANRTTGAYTLSTTTQVRDALTAGVAAKVNGSWLRSAEYPKHIVAETWFQDDLGQGRQLTVTNTGLAGQPDLIAILKLYSSPCFAELQVQVRNGTAKEVTVEAIRLVEAKGEEALKLGGPDSADRVLSDSFSEDRPTMLIHDLSDTKNEMHRAVGSQLIYNRESQQSLFLGALTSERWLTVLRLRLDATKKKISGYEVDSTGTTELAKDNSLRKSPPEDQMELSLPVAPGASLSSERLMIALGPDYHAQLESYGDAVRRMHHARVSAPTPMGWWSWTAYFFGLNQGTALTNAQWLSEHLRNLGYSFFHIDEGYQYARGEYTTPDAALFPEGMERLEAKVRGLELTPGIWTAPFEVSERSWVYENHKDWLVHNASGNPIHSAFVQGGSKEQLYALDTTNPGAQDYLRKTYSTLVKDWGIRYIKLDFMEDSAVEGVRYRPNTTALEAQRIGLQIIRDTVGDDVLLDKDGSPMLNPVGIVDTGRVSADTSHDFADIKDAATGIAARYYMNRNFFLNDPDAFCVSRQTDSEQDRPLTLDEAKVSIALAAVSGGMFQIGDDLPALARDEDRLALVQNPELIRIAKWGHAATPVDLMTYPPEQGIPSAFVLHEGNQRAIVTLFNWADKSFSPSYDLAEDAKTDDSFWRAFGLQPGRYRVRDALDAQKPVEFGGRQFAPLQPPHSVRVLILEKDGVPPPEIHAEILGPSTAKAGETISLSAGTKENKFPIVENRWSFGDGTSADGIAVQHTYTRSGKYNVTLRSEALDGREVDTTFPIEVTGSIDTSFRPSQKRRLGELSQTPSLPDPRVQENLPAFDLVAMGGQKISSNDLKGKIAVVAFWAAWCGPCRAEMPELQKLYEKYQHDPDVAVLTIVDSRDLKPVTEFVAAQHLTLPVFLSNGYMSKVDIDSFPRTWFVDRQGSIRYVETEEKDHLFDEFSARIERMRTESPSSRTPVAFVVHGGVDSAKRGELSAAEEVAIKVGITRALNAGYAVLKRGDSSIDAVEAALRSFEDDTTFDAGHGSVVNTEGVAELDAAIMDGETLKAGSVAAVQHIPHPISLARLVMERSPHVMLVAEGAEKFATSQGMEKVPNSYFITPSRKEKYQQWLRSHGAAADSKKHLGTTGAVALDSKGNLAAGTTTGGTSWKLPGRVGDSPLIGAGTYASNSLGCAVSSSGTGEYFIRNTVATDICRRTSYLHETIDEAADYVINTELKEQGGDGGIIVLDRTGHFVRVFNTNAFWVGYIDPDGNPVVEIFR